MSLGARVLAIDARKSIPKINLQIRSPGFVTTLVRNFHIQFPMHCRKINPLHGYIAPAIAYLSTQLHQRLSKWVEKFSGLMYSLLAKNLNFQGLRGVGSLLVMTGHVVRGFFPLYL